MPQPSVCERPSMIAGTPGIVPPITPPELSCIRARYQIDGAVKPRCGSFASRVPPEAERDGAAAQTFEAPASPRGATGISMSLPIWSACANFGMSGKSDAYSGNAATP